MKKLVVFDSHPVQYRVPIWQGIEKAIPGYLHVVYASDCSIKGYVDKEFGQTVIWDGPMLEGYAYSILNSERGEPLSGINSLTGEGVAVKMDELNPDIVLLTGLNYRFDWAAYREARKRNIPVWLRCETQDEAIRRSVFKGFARYIVYKIVYKGFSRMFYIGELNRQHYLRHGVNASGLIAAPYCLTDSFVRMSSIEKKRLRQQIRVKANIDDSMLVVGFSGKFIPKKNPDILFRSLNALSRELKKRVHLYFIGSGELKEEMEDRADNILRKYGIKTFFSGFVNQSELAPHYLALDILVLPSRRMGETWGLVANEGMQAGCAVVVSNAVGSYADFSGWERFRVFKENDENDLANKIEELANFKRDFDWASEKLKQYSIEAVVTAFLTELKK